MKGVEGPVGKLDDMVAIIGGASTGMGAATARLFAQEGAAVVVAARSAEKLDSLVEDITESGGTALAVPTDANDRAAVAAMVERAREQFGRIDVLVNSVGTNIKNRAFTEMRPADWDMMIAHNLTVAYNLVDAVLPVMRAQGAGTIIHYSSDAVQKPNVVSGIAYQATKHGVRGLAHGTMMEERMRGIRVSVVYPALVKRRCWINGRSRRLRKHSPRCYNRKTWRRRRSSSPRSSPRLRAGACARRQARCSGCGVCLLLRSVA